MHAPKRLIGLLLTGVIAPVMAGNNTERMSARDLFYKLYEQSANVDITLEAEKQRKRKQQEELQNYHHKIQRIGPDPKKEDDITYDQPPDPNVLHEPYLSNDERKDIMNGKIPAEELPSDPTTNALTGAGEESANTPLGEPDTSSINTKNPLIQTDEQLQFLNDKSQPLKPAEQRPPADPNQIKAPDTDPLSDPVK